MTRVNMNPERWLRIKSMFAAAADLPAAERNAFLARECGDDAELAAEVRSLLESHEKADAFLEPVPEVLRAAALDAGPTSGERIGPYRLIEKIGVGGMGDVYKAVRDDSEYRAEVAIKLMRADVRNALAEQRFRTERQILAALDHRNIARLLDGGTTPEGLPYVVMELVAGEPIDRYCDSRQLGTRERVALFLQVCAAVNYAHQHLVVHRDLKPGNILVTADGSVKLLDFGIAKLLESDPATGTAPETRTLLRPMTLEYASPEQVAGLSVTTASDVYSLGVVLYRLITGQSPYRSNTSEAARIAEILGDTSPTRPSVAGALTRTGIDSDLDYILLMALRKESGSRYGSVERFAADLRAYLDGLPVAARRGTLGYRAAKFARRNKVAIAAAVVVVASLVIGLGLALREARIAQRHFDSVRTLANTFIRDIEQDLRGLAGTLPVREKLAKTSVKYLDSLSSESDLDSSLLAELASGYRRVAEVFAGSGAGNLGNTDAAMEYLEKAAAVFEVLHRRGVSSRSILDDERRMHYTLTGIYLSRKDLRWEQQSLLAMEALRKLADGPGGTAYDGVTAAGLMIEHLAKMQDGRHVPLQSSPLLEEAKKRLAAVGPRVGNDLRAKGNLAIAYFTLAELLMESGASVDDLNRAATDLSTSNDMLGEVVRQAPDDIAYAAMQDQVQVLQSQALLRLGRTDEAEALIAAVLLRSARNMEKDRDNVDMLLVHWQALVQGTEIAYRNQRIPLALQRGREAWRLESTASKDVIERVLESSVSRATAQYFGGLALLAASPAQRSEACEHLRAVEMQMPQLRQELGGEAAVQAAFGELAPALQRCPR